MIDPNQTRRALENFKRALSCDSTEREALLASSCGAGHELLELLEV
ncbi:MAG: hypothetical protein ACI80N_001979, partial [Gammaproteobacteria bacterium]